jgi:uncharacterized protein YdcH (DUF465 family)
MNVLTKSDKLNPVDNQWYSNPNKYRVLGTMVRPIKTADQIREKNIDRPAQLPIGEMIMKNIDKISVIPGVWSKLCNDYLKLNEEITQTHENETKGPDLSIAALKSDRLKLILLSKAFANSPTKSQKSLSRMSSRRSKLHSRHKSTVALNKVRFVNTPSNKDAEI